MATPKVHLKKLYISAENEIEEREVKELMDIVSEGTGDVEKLTYRGSVLSGDSFDKFISINRSS